MIYVASPYSHEQEDIRRLRFQDVRFWVKENQKFYAEPLFSPIVYGHVFQEAYGGDYNFEAHVALNDHLIRHSSLMLVLKIDGWGQSRGIKYERKLAKSLNIPVQFVEMFSA